MTTPELYPDVLDVAGIEHTAARELRRFTASTFPETEPWAMQCDCGAVVPLDLWERHIERRPLTLLDRIRIAVTRLEVLEAAGGEAADLKRGELAAIAQTVGALVGRVEGLAAAASEQYPVRTSFHRDPLDRIASAMLGGSQ